MRQLEPGNRPAAEPPPPPPRREARNELKPATAFRIPASRTQLRHPRPAPVSDLDPDHTVPRRDRDRDRLPGSTRAAVPDAIAEQLAHQQDGHVPARVSRTEHPAQERTGDQRPLRPPGKCHALPAIRAPAFPAALVPGNHAGRADTRMHARLGGARQARTRRQRGPSVVVRGKPTVTPTARQARTPSAIRPWTPQYDGLQCDKVTHAGTEKKRPAGPRFRSERAVFAGGGRWWVRTNVG